MANRMYNKEQIGIIKWFDKVKGFGVIITANDGEYFIHGSNIIDMPEKILVATSFVFEKGLQKGKKTALNCRIPSTKSDFLIALRFVGLQRTVKIEVETKEKSTRGNSYVKKELKSYDILSYYLFKLLNNKPFEIVRDYFITGFIKISQQNDINKIIDYYKITNNKIKTIKLAEIQKNNTEFPENKSAFQYLNFLDTESELLGFKNLNDLLLNELVNYYNANSTSIVKFKVWQTIGELYIDLNTKLEPPFNENIFLEFCNELQYDDFERIAQFKISEKTQQKIIENFIKDTLHTLDELKNAIAVINSFELKLENFDIILKRISNELYFQIWSSREIFINYNQKSFSLNFSYNNDFEIPLNILILKANQISINLIERIYKNFSNKDIYIFKILIEKIKNQSINSENTLDFIKSVNFLDVEYQNEILGLFLNSCENIDWEILIESKKLNILPNSIGQILSYNFQINDLLIDKIANIIYFCKKIDLQLKIIYLSNFSNSYINSFVEICKNKFTDKEKLLIVQVSKSNRIVSLFLSEWKFEDNYYTIEFIKFCNENQKKLLVQNFISNSVKIEISSIIYLINVFIEHDIAIQIENVDFFKKSDISLNDFSKIIELHKKLKNENYNSLEQQIIRYLDNNASDNSDMPLEIIKNTNSIILLEKALKKCNAISNVVKYLDLLKSNNVFNKAKPDILYANLLNYIADYPILILETSLHSLSQYYDLFTQQITLNKQVIIDFYELLSKNEMKIKQLTKSNCDLNTLVFFHFNFTEQSNIQEINNLFKKYNFDFQSLILKFYFKKCNQNTLSKNQVLFILNSIECVELSSLMIKKFIHTQVKNRDELMNLMNQILKTHFKLLSEKNLTDTTFSNIFSLDNLVKMCDGRKSYSGTTIWKGGNNTRFYTNGNHYVSVGQKENMLCEGRFWKSQPFFNSNTNKPSIEQYNFYWCKNSPCAGVNDKVDFDLPFEKWSLLEINDLFQINLDRLAFVHLAGWLNRMQSIFDRMKCKECNNFLRPKAFTPHLLGYYAVPLFICANEQCHCFNKEIRFTHCRGCNKILDSRECKVCSSCKWLICDDDNCGKCGCGAIHNPIYAQYT